MGILENFKTIRNTTVDICQPLKTEDYIPQPVPFVSPPKWHLAHTTWFFEEMILRHYVKDYKAYDSNFGFLFNSYYNSIGDRTFRADRGNITRPSVQEVYAYRAYIDQAMTDLLNDSQDPEIIELTSLGLNHEQQHQELLITDFKYILGHNPTFPVYSEKVDLLTMNNTTSGWIEIEEGTYEIGAAGNSFSFDNEHGTHKVYSMGFNIENRLITNGEYIDFIESGSYNDFNYWLDEGWSWVNENNIKSPLYWHKINGKWHYYTLSGLKEVDPLAILGHVSFYEASAFAAFKGLRLPTEFEWEIAADQLKWGDRWEWTNSAYLPYPGFKISEGAVGEYNGKFMINQMVLRGASQATACGHSRKTYRNFFHPHNQWQYTGIRLAK